jgi:hypothetical protein
MGEGVTATTIVHGGQSAVEITTPAARWVYPLEAGGFSSIRDRDGVEWIGFAPGKPAVPGGAANVFRGIPNLVYPDNLGHPGYRGVETSWSADSDRVVLESASADGNWRWRWTVTGSGARLEVLDSSSDRTYWFLYEGTPGGRYDLDGATWGVDPAAGRTGSFTGQPAPTLASPATGSWRAAWFGHRSSPRVLLLQHESAADAPSMLGWMAADHTGNDGMVVFGFGRSHAGGPVSHLRGVHEFSVRFVESNEPEVIARLCRALEEE